MSCFLAKHKLQGKGVPMLGQSKSNAWNICKKNDIHMFADSCACSTCNLYKHSWYEMDVASREKKTEDGTDMYLGF